MTNEQRPTNLAQRAAWNRPELRRLDAGQAQVSPGNNQDAAQLS